MEQPIVWSMTHTLVSAGGRFRFAMWPAPGQFHQAPPLLTAILLYTHAPLCYPLLFGHSSGRFPNNFHHQNASIFPSTCLAHRRHMWILHNRHASVRILSNSILDCVYFEKGGEERGRVNTLAIRIKRLCKHRSILIRLKRSKPAT
jgi:hypothetical protein